MSSIRNLKDSQQGMVSIIITMIIMAVLSLIVVGFAQLARREQRQTLDKQLSTQAFYAAESGINDAVKAIESGAYTKDKTTCDNPASQGLPSPEINTNTKVSYTCLLLDQSPESLEYSTIGINDSTVSPLNPVESNDPTKAVSLDSLSISWNSSDATSTGGYYGAGDFPSSGSAGWGDREAGVLRIDLIPTTGTLTRDSLINKTYTAFLYPISGGGANVQSSYNYTDGFGSPDKQGQILKVKCGTKGDQFMPHKCKFELKSLPASVQNYYIRISSIYSSSAVTISGMTTAPILPANIPSLARQVSFIGSQYVIDSTGKAGDVIKRIRVHKPTSNTNYKYPNFAVDSAESICKKLSVYPGGGTNTCPTGSPVPATPTP